MSRKDLTLALLVVIIWGANFTVIKLGLEGVPPMLLAALRYTATALPAIAFVKRPALDWRYCVVYALTVGVAQFGCLFYSMEIGMPAGAASVVLQSQAFFTLLFAALLLKEALQKKQMAGLVVAAAGLCFIGSASAANGVAAIPVGAFVLVLCAASFWGLSNIIVRYAANWTASRGERLDMQSLVVWSSLVPPLPFLGIALLLDTPQTLVGAIKDISPISIFAVLFLAYCATLFGFGTWSRLLAKYPAGMVAPLSLLVPVTGLITARIVLGEQLSKAQWLGSLLVLLGLVIVNFDLSSVKRILHKTEESV